MNSAAEFAPWISLLGSGWNIALALFVLKRDPRAESNIVFFFLGLAISIWNGCQAVLFVTTEASVALTALRIMWLGIACGPVLLLHLSILAAEHKRPRILIGLYGLCFTFAGLAFTPFFIVGSRDLGAAGWYAVPGPLLFFYHPVFMLMVFSSVTILWLRRRSLRGLGSSKLDPLILAQLLLLGAGLNDVLPIFGIDTYPFSTIPVFPYGSVLAAFYGLIVSYSVLQNQVMDLKITLSRNAAQLIRFAFILGITLLLLLIAATLAPHEFTRTSIALTLAAVFVSIAAASFLFPRLFGEGLLKLEQRILGDRLEYHDRARAFLSTIHLYRDSPTLLQNLDDLLLNGFQLDHYHLFSIDAADGTYNLYHSGPPSRTPAAVSGNALLEYFGETDADYIATTGPAGGRSKSIAAARLDLAQGNGQLAIPLKASEKLLGILVFGPRREDLELSAADVHVLLSLATPLSLFVNQVQLKDQILHAQELEMLGRMSRGMAHDLNNLLTPVHTLLQLVLEGMPPDQLDDLLPVAHRNVATMRAYIREALFFSQNLRPDFQLGRLDVVAQNAALLVEDRARKRDVKIVVDAPQEARVELDSVLIERLITNLVSNAVDASPAGAEVGVSFLRITRESEEQTWWRVTIQDSGSGISPENLGRIFTPYFTTKQTGDESRGFGLGLAICRKIVNLHGGSLNVVSRKGDGTRVHVDLPAAQSNDQRTVSRFV